MEYPDDSDHLVGSSPWQSNAQPILPDAIEPSQPNGSMQSPPLNQQPPQSQPQQQSPQPQNQQARSAPNRYHGGANRNVQRQNIPQYKLQAKVTSLERTGRKDPVLRFDVHVSLMHFLTDCRTLLIFPRPICPNLEQANFGMSGGRIQNSRNSPTT